MVRNYFLTIPKALEESARMDGMKDIGIIFKIYMPLSVASLATIFFLAFVTKWNDLVIPATILTKSEYYTLPLVIKSILTQGSVSGAPPATNNAIMAAILITTLPLLFIYLIAQKYLVSGMTIGAVKG